MKKIRFGKQWLWSTTILIALIFGLNVFMSTQAYADDYEVRQVDILSADKATNINAILFMPKVFEPTKRFPAIIFINSWVMNKYEYVVQAQQFAEQGYVVLSYSARGWGKSDGYVNVAGPEDMADFGAVLSWLKLCTPVDRQKIGVSGISYGGGISLMAMVHYPEIKTGAIMSAWSNLYDAFYKQETARVVWGGILVGTGYLTGRMDPMIGALYQNLLKNEHIPEMTEWARGRSAKNYLDELNARVGSQSMYINSNLEDELFQPNDMFDFFQHLQLKKHMDLSLGIHASAELAGLTGMSTFVWNNVHRWFDQELKGIDNDMKNDPTMTMAVKFTDNERDEFVQWPGKTVMKTPYYIGQRGWVTAGSLSTTPLPADKNDEFDTIHSGGITGMSSGIPVIGPLFEAHFNVPVTAWLPGTNRLNSVVYESDKLTETLKIRGIPSVTLSVKPNAPEVQLVGYLYDVDSVGGARLITHGPVTLRHAVKDEWQTIHFDLIVTAYNVPEGHHLALGLNTHDSPYGAVKGSYKIQIRHDDPLASVLELPQYR